MFERFTKGARRVVLFARYKASKFGSPFIESEFLLLGILHEDKDAISRWLGEGDWQTILREDVEKHVHKGPASSTSTKLRVSKEAKRVLAYAAEESERLSHRHIGVEHLLLGLMRQPESHVAKLLFDRGVDPKVVREIIVKEGGPILERGPHV